MKFCDHPFYYGYFPTDGEVWPCPWLHYVIGNLYEQDLEEIWHSKEAQEARNSILDGSFAYCRKVSCPYLERDELPDLTEEEIKIKAVATEIPQFMNICNDYTCNIACTKCRKSVYHPKEGEREKIDEALEKLLPYANRTQTLTVNGRGEFLANPSYIKFLQNLKPERDDFTLGLETNSVLFDEAHWGKISIVGNYNLNVTATLDSINREVYRYLSGGFDHLERVLNNLRFLSSLRREGKINTLRLAMVVQECNFWEIPEYINKFAHSEEYEFDEISMKPLYKWWGMDREVYWFKNMLNPLHPYHKAYLHILENECWNDPKVYDWACHNIREPRLHPLNDDRRFAHLLMAIYDNDKGLSPSDYLRVCLEREGIKSIGFWGENDYTDTFLRLLREAGTNIAFKLTRYEEAEGDPPAISLPNLLPDSADAILMTEFYDQQNRTNNLRSLKFQGKILNLQELIEGENR